MFQEAANTLCLYYPPECINGVAPPGAGAVNYINFWFGEYLQEYIYDPGNMELWELYRFTASCKKILITHIYRDKFVHRLTILNEI